MRKLEEPPKKPTFPANFLKSFYLSFLDDKIWLQFSGRTSQSQGKLAFSFLRKCFSICKEKAGELLWHIYVHTEITFSINSQCQHVAKQANLVYLRFPKKIGFASKVTVIRLIILVGSKAESIWTQHLWEIITALRCCRGKQIDSSRRGVFLCDFVGRRHITWKPKAVRTKGKIGSKWTCKQACKRACIQLLHEHEIGCTRQRVL